VADEQQGAFAEAALKHQVEHLPGTVGECHALPGVAPVL
jgi:hypothetical protein